MPFKQAILDSYVWIPVEELQTTLEELQASLTSRSIFDPSVEVPLYSQRFEARLFGFPRHHFPLTKRLADRIIDRRTDGVEINFNVTTELYDYQENAAADFRRIVERNGTGIFLEAPPGSGKTVMGIKFIEMLGRSALVVVPKSDLVDQWIERFTEHSTLSVDDIARAENGFITKDWEDKPVTVALVHTLALDRFGRRFKEHFGTVLYDEADSSVPPPTFAPVGGMFPARYRIAMTASPTRSDGMHTVFQKHVGQFYIRIDKGKTMQPTVIILEYHNSSGFVPPDSPAMNRRGMLLSKLSANYDRNLVIARYAMKCYHANRPTLVISDRKEQLKTIRSILLTKYKVPMEEIGYYVRSLDGKVLTKRYKGQVTGEAKIILATYGMIRRGTDIQRLSALILATPQSDLRQTAGRIERFMEGKKAPILIDITDTAHADARRWSKARMKHYNQKNMTVKVVVV
jgi:superfamily II DNA or RNA helicase